MKDQIKEDTRKNSHLKLIGVLSTEIAFFILRYIRNMFEDQGNLLKRKFEIISSACMKESMCYHRLKPVIP